MSFYTSLTGLNGAQADIAAISNNIANVGTTGFKRSRAEFGDIFATSPLQANSSAVGSGTIMKSIKQQFTQGNIESSLNALDLSISGQGFFALKPSLTSTQTVYTRNGAFSVNNDRYVVDAQGQLLQVFPVNADGSVIATGISSAKNLQLPTN
jgi:flagellar hook protein FlgE